jgi:hypothetical protein
LLEDGRLQRTFAFKPVDGALELALNEAVAGATSTPDAVTRVLAAALSQLGDHDVSTARINALCVADRQQLMRGLESHFERDHGWLTATCGHCEAKFDLQVDVATLPVTSARPGFPFASVRAGGRDWRARVPNGADQIWLAQQPADDLPQRLAARLFLDEGFAAPDLDAELVARLDAALDAVAPAVVLQLAATCPECGRSNRVPLDPYTALEWSGDELLRDVHRIAAHYHWSESDILSLPLARRRVYLDLIDQARGFAAQPRRR